MMKLDYYSDFIVNTFFFFENLQRKFSKFFIDLELLNAVIFWFTNVVRKTFNLNQFKFHNRLMEIELLHSEQMKYYKFFDHENAFNERYKTLTDCINSVEGINFPSFMSWGENIADYPVIKANEQFTIEKRNGMHHFFSINGKEIFPFSYYEYAKTVVEGWMKSSGHRENILNPNFTYLGWGVQCTENKATDTR